MYSLGSKELEILELLVEAEQEGESIDLHDRLAKEHWESIEQLEGADLIEEGEGYGEYRLSMKGKSEIMRQTPRA